MTLRVVEVYASYQGEGPNTSRPTVFVRFAGCNFKCPGWPCDTQHAIDPKIFKDLQVGYSPAELAEVVLHHGIDNICLTGGEVFLQRKEDLSEFITLLKQSDDNIGVECFTNGALDWGDDVPAMINNFILDWKLPGSGENYEGVNYFAGNFEWLKPHDAIKFTIKDHPDFLEAVRRYEKFIRDLEDPPQVYAGVVWGQQLTTEILCQWMLEAKLPWRLNVQVHKFVWHPDKIGV